MPAGAIPRGIETRGTRMSQVKALIVDDSSVMRKIVEHVLPIPGL